MSELSAGNKRKGRGTLYCKIGPLSEIDFIQPISFLHTGKVNFNPNYSIKMGFGCIPSDFTIPIQSPSKQPSHRENGSIVFFQNTRIQAELYINL